MNKLWQKAVIAGAATTAAITAGLIDTKFASAQTSDVYCGSSNYQRQTCPTNTRDGVKLINQFSKISCEGKWGVGKGYVWVEDGCRATFRPLYSQNERNVQYEQGRRGDRNDSYEYEYEWEDREHRNDRNERNDRDDRDYEQRNSRDYYEELNDIYREVLDRDIDRKGYRTYTKRLKNGWSLSRVRQDVAKSDEAKAAINRLYQEVLGREADTEGLRSYQKWLADGWSLRRVRKDIKNSREAQRN